MPSTPFTDVGDAWYLEAVEYVYDNAIMAGMSDTTFEPETSLTRAQAVQLFYNLEGKPDLSEENLGYPYADVTPNAWYNDAVYWARLTGVSVGMGENIFAPEENVSREQFAQMLYNYAKYKELDLSKTGDLTKFSDAGSISPLGDHCFELGQWQRTDQRPRGHWQDRCPGYHHPCPGSQHPDEF